MNGERVGDPRDDALEVVELRANGVHQEQGWAGAYAEVSDAGAAAQRDVADLPALAPRLGVVVRCFVLVLHRLQPLRPVAHVDIRRS